MAPAEFMVGVVLGTSLILAGAVIEQAAVQLLFGSSALPELDLAPYRLADVCADDPDWRVYATPLSRQAPYDPIAIVYGTR